MNGPGDTPLNQDCSTPEIKPCSLVSIIPIPGMSSCRGRAEAFARRLSSKLRTLGSQSDEDPTSQEDDEPIMNGGNSANTWIKSLDSEHTVTDLQPLRNESDSFFDFDCELESPGSPVDECEYLRLIETASNTPHNSAAESGYVCASAASSHSSCDGPYYDVINTENGMTRTTITSTAEHPDNVSTSQCNGTQESIHNGHDEEMNEGNKDTVDCAQNTKVCAQSNEVKELPITGPDETLKSPQENEYELTANDLAAVQNHIIQELQKQSADFVDSTFPHMEHSEKPESLDVATTKTDSQQVTHKIGNGHLIYGEEIVKIEFEEVDVTQIELTETKSNEVEKVNDAAQTEEDSKNETDEAKLQSSAENGDENEHNNNNNSAKGQTRLSGLDTTEDEDEDDCRPQRVRRCSSLKTGKTPPGTPGRKKIVRFADVLGLDLADVKTFLDEIPTIPKSAFEDLEILDQEPPIQLGGPKTDKLLMPLFQQPGGLPTFLDMVREKQVSLENAAVTDNINQTITGTVRVRNLDFHKSVHIRYTLDGWRSFADLQANYVENTCDGFSDKFTFVLFGNSLHIGQRLEFAVRFQCKGQQFWDSNYGANYCFQCLPTSTAATNHVQAQLPSHHTGQHNLASLINPTAGDAWCSSFY